MLEWDEFIKLLLEENCAFDSISLSINGDAAYANIPPLIKASILMLDRMIASQGQYNVMVFPEKIQSLFSFALAKLIHNIAVGRIENTYNPNSYIKGEKLKYDNCVVSFEKIVIKNNIPNFHIKTSDGEYSAPIKMLPLFQRTSTNRDLSTLEKFLQARKKAKELFGNLNHEELQLKQIADYKTYLNSAVFYIAPVISTKEQIAGCRVNEKKLTDLFLIGQADYEGNVKNIGSGQFSGIPSIVLASDMYAANAAVQKGAPIQSLIIDASNPNAINAQLDALDKLIHLGIPITFITDVADSFDLKPITDRKFSIWRWDKDSISDGLYNATPFTSDQKTKNCAKLRTDYILADGNEISDSMRRLSIHKTEVGEQSPRIMGLFDKLYSLTFSALRAIVPATEGDIEHTQNILTKCLSDLSTEKSYISSASYEDYEAVINNLRSIFTSGYSFPKHEALKIHLQDNNYSGIRILVPDRMDKPGIQEYWQKWCNSNHLRTIVSVLNPSEYYGADCSAFSATIVVGWLKDTVMRRIIFSFNTNRYVVMIYDYERRWKNAHTAVWSRSLSNSNNRTIIEKCFNTEKLDISVNSFKEESLPIVEPSTEATDELDKIELILRDNKYRRYISDSGYRPMAEMVDAIPINFVGGYLTFFRSSHKVVTATDIIINDAEKIIEMLPNQLSVGDFMVIREADRDLIKELADTILTNSGKNGLRDLATKWREALKIESLSSSYKQIYEKLKAAGCTVTYQTVRSWIVDEDRIAPENKEDLMYIAKVTENHVLSELFDQIYDASKEVVKAHIKAGRYLSDQLRRHIATALKKYGSIDPFNIWEPIEIALEDIGLVKILKVIDIGSVVSVDIADTNRLIEE